MTVSMEDLRAGRVELDDLIEPGTEALDPVHPSEILRDCVDRVTAILAGRRAISADTALRLARCFGTSAELWLTLQAGYDLEVTPAKRGAAIEAEVKPQAA